MNEGEKESRGKSDHELDKAEEEQEVSLVSERARAFPLY